MDGICQAPRANDSVYDERKAATTRANPEMCPLPAELLPLSWDIMQRGLPSV